MKFQIASDLHIEYKTEEPNNMSNYLVPVADTLILAGDIGSLYNMEQLNSFMEKVCSMYKSVIYVPGNHEYYVTQSRPHIPYGELIERVNILEKSHPNLYCLNNQSMVVEDVCIVGSTLWSEAVTYVPSYIVRIPEMNTATYRRAFETSVRYIEKMIDYCGENKLKLLVVTHHAPSYSVLHPYKVKDRFVSLYASDLDRLIGSDKVHTWVSGHIHYNYDFISSTGTRLVGNQYGKPRDNITDYSKRFVIEV